MVVEGHRVGHAVADLGDAVGVAVRTAVRVAVRGRRVRQVRYTVRARQHRVAAGAHPQAHGGGPSPAAVSIVTSGSSDAVDGSSSPATSGSLANPHPGPPITRNLVTLSAGPRVRGGSRGCRSSTEKGRRSAANRRCGSAFGAFAPAAAGRGDPVSSPDAASSPSRTGADTRRRSRPQAVSARERLQHRRARTRRADVHPPPCLRGRARPSALRDARASGLDATRVLIGGLGHGLHAGRGAGGRRVLRHAKVVVAELVPEIVEWNRGALGERAGHPLSDSRVDGLPRRRRRAAARALPAALTSSRSTWTTARRGSARR